MDRALTEIAIGICLRQAHEHLKDAERIGRAAVACVDAGSVVEGVFVSQDISQLLHEAGQLQDAASLLNRLSDD